MRKEQSGPASVHSLYRLSFLTVKLNRLLSCARACLNLKDVELVLAGFFFTASCLGLVLIETGTKLASVFV